MHADLVNCHSSRCDRVRRICEDATTTRPEPSIRRNLFHSACRTVDTVPRFHVSCRLAVSYARIALPNFYNIAIGIANVAARLAVLGLRLCDELGSWTSPKFITRLNIRNADIYKAAD